MRLRHAFHVRASYVTPFMIERASASVARVDGDDDALIPDSPRKISCRSGVSRRSVSGSQYRMRPSAAGRYQARRVVAVFVSSHQRPRCASDEAAMQASLHV